MKCEEKEMEVRKNSFVPYNITELKSSFGHVRQHDDKTKMLIDFAALSLGKIKIVLCLRLCTWKDHAVNLRPLLVYVENCEVRDKIIRSAE